MNTSLLRPLQSVVVFLVVLAALIQAAEPAPTGTASISGRVQNVATGQYLNNARVSLRGTTVTTYTDESGTFQLAQLPPGAATLEVVYTGLDTQSVSLQLAPGRNVIPDISLTSATRYGPGEIVKLDPYIAVADRETDAQAIATNEQRFAPNIKNVLSTDSLGDVTGSSVGEFLKFIPGVVAEYDNASVVGITMRGIGGGMTNFSADGAPMISSTIGVSRSFDTNSMALNDIARIEVTKVPTPSTPADSLAGSVNMVSKSAFERSSAQFRYGVTLVGNAENLTLRPTPDPYFDRNTWKQNPGVDFDYTLPLGKNFGLVATGLYVNRFNEQHISQMTYNTGGTATGASVTKPYLQSHLVADDPRNEARKTVSLKADWRVVRHAVLSFSVQRNELVHSIGNNRLTPDVGTIGTPTVVGGVPFSFGDDFVVGATGRGSATLSMTNQRYEQYALILRSNFRYDDGTWKVESSLSTSNSKVLRRNTEHGHFHSVAAALIAPVRVTFRNIIPDNPGKVEIFDNTSQLVDYTNFANYRITTAADIPLNKRAKYENGNFSVRRRLGFLPVPASLQLGGAVSTQEMDIRTTTRNWTYAGPDGNINTPDSPAPYSLRTFVNQDPGYGYPANLPWFSPRQAWSAFTANPVLFTQTPAQQVAEEVARISSSEILQETVSAYYLQFETSLFTNRLRLLGGVRYEKTVDEGSGQLYDPNAVFQRDPDGGFAHNAAGARIRKAEAGAAGSMEEARLTRQERAYHGRRTYDGFYPSLHLTYTLRENLLVRAAYAQTYGRPNFSDIIPNATINEADLTDAQLEDPRFVRGTITVRNTALRPWSARNYDLSIEYYTQQGGLLAAALFQKDIKDFFATTAKVATAEDLDALGLESRYVGWNLSTKLNSGDARVTGVELNLRHSLKALGRWGGHFTLFANVTKLKLEGNQQSSFATFIPESGNWGASFSRRQLSLMARWNYRGLDKRGALSSFGLDAFNYNQARTALDLSGSYQLSRRVALSVSVNNVFNVPQVALRYGIQTPDYAKQYNTRNFGAIFSVGLRGSF